MKQQRAYQPGGYDGAVMLRVLDVVERLLAQRGDPQPRSTAWNAILAGEFSLAMEEANETSWFRLSIAGEPIGRVAMADILHELATDTQAIAALEVAVQGPYDKPNDEGDSQ